MPAEVQPIADPTDSLLGWASQHDVELTADLDAATLVADLDLATDELEKVKKLYGIFLSRQITAGSTLKALLEISESTALITLVQRAQKLVDADNFIHEYLNGVGLDITQQTVSELEKFLEDDLEAALKRRGLATFDTDPISTLCFHAGLINTEVPLLLEALDSNPDKLPPYFSRFSAHAPELAQRILDGVLTVREFALAHPHSWVDREDEGVRTSLVTSIREAVIAELRERPVGTVDRLAAVGVANREMRPRLILDARRKKVLLRLPEQKVPDSGEITWRVSIDGSTTVYRTGRSWGDVTGYSDPLDISLPKPVREVTVEDLANSITWNVPVVDAADPILLFNKRGGTVTDKRSLHHMKLRALVPEDYKLIDPVTGAHNVISASFAIEGWSGWTCHNVDLAESQAIDAVAPGTHADLKRARSIDPRQRVSFSTPDDALPDIFTMTGLRVHSTSLLAEFPPTSSGVSEMWYLSIASFSGAGTQGEEVTQPEPLEVPAEGGVFEVFDPELYDAPWVGEYLVRLRGPRNESFRHEFAIVEGALARSTFQGGCGSFRIPSQGGLSEATLIIKPGDKSFEVQPAHPAVGPLDPGSDFVISTDEGDALPLRFSPPRLIFELPTIIEPAMWRASRMSVHPHHIDLAGEIRVRGTRSMNDPKISVINRHGQPVKTTTMATTDGGYTYTAHMSKIVGATHMLPTGRVNLEWTDPATDRRISVVLADSEIADLPHIKLDGSTITSDALGPYWGVWVWPETAPWEPAERLEFSEGRAELPVRYIGSGNLIVQVNRRDPFTALRTPVAPGPQAQTLEQQGFYGELDGGLGTLSAFLSGETDQVPTQAAVMPVLWDILATGGRRGELRKAVRTVFSAQPNAAIRGLAHSLVTSEQQPGRFIETGLVRSIFDKSAGSDESHHRAAWIGALELMGTLSNLYGTEGITAEQRSAARQLYRELQAVAGENVVEILKTGRDQTLDSACIDRSTVMIAGLDPAQQRAILQQLFDDAHIVPGAVLDDGSRLLAVFETFNKRTELNQLLAGEKLIAAAVTILRTLRSTNKTVYALARIRFDKLDGVDTNNQEHLWALSPVVSFVLALASRLSAHGLITSNKTLDAATDGWARMADIVPDLVTSDLVSAEAIVLALSKPGIA
ncbi:hypothetical protein N7326_01795 [Corynebacterium sp. ES2794-CONJ1]|uniref:hypothetical protein n=1 Tax=Corynebacterium sp. ES2794-CONJ1 TaxID=2980553 RepID=UPI0021DA6A7D|nr:hypothetical protein [Corynebacterium sp. ES2794-CONJ1]MCU9518604.1 hypothetical protein [Corynebacterium sp. ES2794-CONJ1]